MKFHYTHAGLRDSERKLIVSFLGATISGGAVEKFTRSSRVSSQDTSVEEIHSMFMLDCFIFQLKRLLD